jgi:hypothetical protein
MIGRIKLPILKTPILKQLDDEPHQTRLANAHQRLRGSHSGVLALVSSQKVGANLGVRPWGRHSGLPLPRIIEKIHKDNHMLPTSCVLKLPRALKSVF